MATLLYNQFLQGGVPRSLPGVIGSPAGTRLLTLDAVAALKPEKLAEFIKAELAKWAPIIRASGAHVD